MSKSIFKGIEKAEVAGGGQYLTPGSYTLEVEEVKTFVSQKVRGRNYFVGEFTILSTTSPEYSPGARVSWLVNMDQPSALANIKGFAVALSSDMSEDDVTADAMDHLISADNPAAGSKVQASAYNIKTAPGNDFTKVSWAPCTS